MSGDMKVRYRSGSTSHTRPRWPSRWHGRKQEQQRRKLAERERTPTGSDWKAALRQIRKRLDGGRS
jgi:hypothetical protein